MDLAAAPACKATQRRTRPLDKPVMTSFIGRFRFLSFCLHFEKEDLFHFYISFEDTYFEHLRGSLLSGFQPGRRGLLTRSKGSFWFTPGVFIRIS
jgi:hypothetical protein